MTTIKERCAYCDYTSKERSTGRIRKKYKLAPHNVLSHVGMHFFFVLKTPKKWMKLKDKIVVKIKKNDWDWRLGGHLNADESIIDLKEYDLVSDRELKKQKKRRNYEHVGELKLDKLQEIIRAQGKINKSGDTTSYKERKLIEDVLGDPAQQIIEDLKL